MEEVQLICASRMSELCRPQAMFIALRLINVSLSAIPTNQQRSVCLKAETQMCSYLSSNAFAEKCVILKYAANLGAEKIWTHGSSLLISSRVYVSQSQRYIQ